MCHSATARPTHGVVVDRAVFVPWNPPTTTRSRTRTGFVFCFSHFAVPCVMCWNSSVVLAGVLDVHFQSRPLCPPCSCPRQRQRRPRQICPPSWFCESPSPRQGRPPIAFASAVFASVFFASAKAPSPSGSSAVPARVARQALFASAKAPSPPGSSAVRRVAHQALFASAGALSPPGSSAVPARVGSSAVPARSPAKLFAPARPSSFRECQSAVPAGRPPSPPNSPAKLFLQVPKRVVRQALFENPKAPSRQGRPPSLPASPAKLFFVPKHRPRSRERVDRKLFLRVPKRRPRQGRPPSPSGSPAKLFLRVPKRRPRQGRPPSPPGSPAKLFLRVPKRRPRQSSVFAVPGSSAVPAMVARQALFASAKAPSPPDSSAQAASAKVPSPPGSSAVPARVARQALFASAKAPSPPGVRHARVARQALFASAKAPSPPGSSAVPPGSPAKLFLRVPKRGPGQDRPPSCFSAPGSSAGPARVARQAL